MTSITLTAISYDLAGAVAATGISEDSIRAAIQSGDLVANYVGAKATKPILRAIELDAWIASLPTDRGGRRMRLR
ncbi:MAG: hypothetical protein KJ792_04590 [Actinobacteria bacterium]|nr:hypothetical protein [Actinomycetota bacterium]MCG2801279.1 hypothetical protein [Cellulomonas sp.]